MSRCVAVLNSWVMPTGRIRPGLRRLVVWPAVAFGPWPSGLRNWAQSLHDWGWDKDHLGELATPTNKPAADAVRDATDLLPGLHRPQSLSPSDMLVVAYGVAHGIGEATTQEQAASVGPERGGQAALLRDIVGNPFRPLVPVPPAVLAWNDGAVRRIAQAAYDERILPAGTLDTGRLVILADALLDAGADDENLLAHLRCGGEHVRGCHVVDAILGKS